jgi:hypothetical protein
MTPKQREAFARLPVDKKAAAEAYYHRLAEWEAEYTEFRRAQVKLKNKRRALEQAHSAVGSLFGATPDLYVDLYSGVIYEIEGHASTNQVLKKVVRVNADGRDAKQGAQHSYPKGPLVRLDPDDPFREVRKKAVICQRLEGEGK